MIYDLNNCLQQTFSFTIHFQFSYFIRKTSSSQPRSWRMVKTDLFSLFFFLAFSSCEKGYIRETLDVDHTRYTRSTRIPVDQIFYSKTVKLNASYSYSSISVVLWIKYIWLLNILSKWSYIFLKCKYGLFELFWSRWECGLSVHLLEEFNRHVMKKKVWILTSLINLVNFVLLVTEKIQMDLMKWK